MAMNGDGLFSKARNAADKYKKAQEDETELISKIGKEMYEANQKAGISSSDNSAIYLILSIFGFSIITYCLVQSELNTLAKNA